MAMTQINVAEATGPALDWLVAKCDGLLDQWGVCAPVGFRPSADWAQGGPIIEREHIDLEYDSVVRDWRAIHPMHCRGPALAPASAHGDTALMAAMRCYVVSKLGPAA